MYNPLQITYRLTEISSNKIFGGLQKIYSYNSKQLQCNTKFAIYLPSQSTKQKLPVLYWMSGLTRDETTFITRAAAQKYLAEEGIILVCPDTSPRGFNIPDDPKSEDLGIGAGFYINATQEPWKKNYRMYSYITSELIDLIDEHFPTMKGKQSIFGHSVGGHGALICALKNPGLYKSVSTFAGCTNPIISPWGIKAFSGYLGPKDTGDWQQWDATELVKSYSGPLLELFLDQGTIDEYYHIQLHPENLIMACKSVNMPAILKMREGYDHTYYFLATFMEEHIKYHSKFLKG